MCVCVCVNIHHIVYMCSRQIAHLQATLRIHVYALSLSLCVSRNININK